MALTAIVTNKTNGPQTHGCQIFPDLQCPDIAVIFP